CPPSAPGEPITEGTPGWVPTGVSTEFGGVTVVVTGLNVVGVSVVVVGVKVARSVWRGSWVVVLSVTVVVDGSSAPMTGGAVSLPGVWDPGPPGAFGSLPPGLEPGSFPPGLLPAGSFPPGLVPLGSLPPGLSPPGLLPPGLSPPGLFPPGFEPPGLVPPGFEPPGPVLYPPLTSSGM